jgi:hypothetical protein
VRYLSLLLLAGLAWSQGTEPKAKADDYETSETAGRVAIGAEYMVHSYSGNGKTFLAPEYLIVEAALFPKKGEPITASQGDFALRIDGKTLLRTASAQQVVQSIERRGWTNQRGVQASAGDGNSGVILGGPRQTPPYGQSGGQTPRAPRAPEPDYRGNVPRGEDVKPAELVTQTAFPDGNFAGAVSGYLYFYFRGNASKIHTVELLYNGVTLKLK